MAKNKTQEITVYGREQILRSERYEVDRDVLATILEEDRFYSVDEIDALLKTFNEKEV